MKQKQKSNKETTNQATKSISTALMLNLVFALISLWGVKTLIDKNQGYNWMYNSLLKGNMEVIKRHPNPTINERLRMKMRNGFVFFEHIQANVPTNAIILFPDASEDIFKKKDAFKFHHPKLALIRFVYPRIIVKSTETDNYYYDKYTHVAIIDNWGYDKLPYTLENKPRHAVLPVTPKNNEK